MRGDVWGTNSNLKLRSLRAFADTEGDQACCKVADRDFKM